MKRVFAFIGFTCAIALIVLNLISFDYSLLIISIAAVLFVSSLLIKSLRQARVLPVVFGSIIFACLIFITVNTSAVMPAKSLDGVSAHTSFKIVNIPQYDVLSDTYTYDIKTLQIDKQLAPQTIKVKLKTNEKLEADYYDTVSANLTFYSSCDTAFESYGDYGNGIYIRARLNKIYDVTSNDSKPLNYHIIKLRHNIFDLLNRELKGDEAGICIALLTGNKSYLSADTQNNLRICGLSHFFAVSGFHITLICMGLYYFLKFLRVPKILNTILTVIFTFVYCGIADFSSSALRAGIMIAIMLFVQLFNYKADGLNSLGMAVFILCLNPFAVTDSSAFMSVSAMLGIYLIYGKLSAEYKVRNKILKKLDSYNLLSGCVLLSLLPAVYIFFGNVSIGSCFLNVIVEPVIIILVVLTIVLCVFSAGPLATLLPVKIIKVLSGLLISLLDYVSNDFSRIYITLSDEIFGIALFAIFIFIAICLFVHKKVRAKYVVAFVAITLVICSSLNWYQQNVTAYTYIDKNGMVVMYDNSACIVVGMKSAYDKRKAEKIAQDRDVVFVDCDEYVNNVNLSEDYEKQLNKNMSVKIYDSVINVSIYDKDFKICNDCVIIDSVTLKRQDDSVSYYDKKNIVLSYTNGSEILVREET